MRLMLGKIVSLDPEKRSCQVQVNSGKTLQCVFYLTENGQITPKVGDLVSVENDGAWWRVTGIVENGIRGSEGLFICHANEVDFTINGEQVFLSKGAGWFS